MNREISELRKTYSKSSLDIVDLPDDPLESFKQWFQGFILNA